MGRLLLCLLVLQLLADPLVRMLFWYFHLQDLPCTLSTTLRRLLLSPPVMTQIILSRLLLPLLLALMFLLPEARHRHLRRRRHRTRQRRAPRCYHALHCAHDPVSARLISLSLLVRESDGVLTGPSPPSVFLSPGMSYAASGSSTSFGAVMMPNSWTQL